MYSVYLKARGHDFFSYYRAIILFFLIFKKTHLTFRLLTTHVVLFMLASGFAGGTACQAQTERPVYKFRHLDKELNNNQVSSIFHDRYGYIWIGTFGGLHKYDGVKFELFLASEEENSLYNDRIETIFEDSRG